MIAGRHGRRRRALRARCVRDATSRWWRGSTCLVPSNVLALYGHRSPALRCSASRTRQIATKRSHVEDAGMSGRGRDSEHAVAGNIGNRASEPSASTSVHAFELPRVNADVLSRRQMSHRVTRSRRGCVRVPKQERFPGVRRSRPSARYARVRVAHRAYIRKNGLIVPTICRGFSRPRSAS